MNTLFQISIFLVAFSKPAFACMDGNSCGDPLCAMRLLIQSSQSQKRSTDTSGMHNALRFGSDHEGRTAKRRRETVTRDFAAQMVLNPEQAITNLLERLDKERIPGVYTLAEKEDLLLAKVEFDIWENAPRVSKSSRYRCLVHAVKADLIGAKRDLGKLILSDETRSIGSPDEARHYIDHDPDVTGREVALLAEMYADSNSELAQNYALRAHRMSEPRGTAELIRQYAKERSPVSYNERIKFLMEMTNRNFPGAFQGLIEAWLPHPSFRVHQAKILTLLGKEADLGNSAAQAKLGTYWLATQPRNSQTKIANYTRGVSYLVRAYQSGLTKVFPELLRAICGSPAVNDSPIIKTSDYLELILNGSQFAGEYLDRYSIQILSNIGQNPPADLTQGEQWLLRFALSEENSVNKSIAFKVLFSWYLKNGLMEKLKTLVLHPTNEPALSDTTSNTYKITKHFADSGDALAQFRLGKLLASSPEEEWAMRIRGINYLHESFRNSYPEALPLLLQKVLEPTNTLAVDKSKYIDALLRGAVEYPELLAPYTPDILYLFNSAQDLDLSEAESWVIEAGQVEANRFNTQSILIKWYLKTNAREKLKKLAISNNAFITSELLRVLHAFAETGDAHAENRLVYHYTRLRPEVHTEEIKNFLMACAFKGDVDAKNMLLAWFDLKRGLYHNQEEGKHFIAEFLKRNDTRAKALAGRNLVVNPSHPDSIKEGISLLMSALASPYDIHARADALKTLFFETEVPIKTRDLYGIAISIIAPRIEDQVRFAHRCEVSNAQNILQPQDGVRIHWERLGDLAPRIEVGPSIAMDTFFDVMAGVIAQTEENAEIQQQLIASCKEKLSRYFEDNSVDGAKLRKVAEHLVSISDEKTLQAEMMILVQNIQSCRTGIREAVDYSYNNLKSTVYAGGRQISQTFHPLMDSIVRKIKVDTVETRLFSDPTIDLAQRVHLTTAAKEILGKDLGLWSEGQVFRGDPLQTIDIQKSFETLGLLEASEWKSYLFREFFFHYTPNYLIRRFADEINVWLKEGQLERYNELVDVFTNGGTFELTENEIDLSEGYALTFNGAKTLLLKYGYIEDVAACEDQH